MSAVLEAEKKRYLTTDEAAKSIGVTRWRVWQWIKAGEMRAVRAGVLWLVPEDEIQKFIVRDKKVGRPRSGLPQVQK